MVLLWGQMPKTQDISHETVRIGRMLDRQPPGRYMMILDIPPRDQPTMGWDVELLSLESAERVVLKREMPENSKRNT